MGNKRFLVALLCWVSLVRLSSSQCPTAFWNFGDSLTDTGSASNFAPQFIDAERSPYGEAFFERPSKRFTNGRVVPDYFSLAFRKPLLQPYIQAGAFDYRSGANFASGGATARNDTTVNPIFFLLQVAQFNRLRLSANFEKRHIQCSSFWPFLPVGAPPLLPFLPRDDAYSKGLYTIEIGGNDILNSLLRNRSSPQFITDVVIPEAMTNIKQGFKILYNGGARNVLFFNLPNAGCSTVVITFLGGLLPVDSQGCVILVNQLDQLYNAALNATVSELRTTYPQARIALFNYYAANEEILLNPTRYGFNPSLTKRACCGAAGLGTLNYNPQVPCGAAGSNKCSNPEEYVNWDGVHFTEAFYRVIARFALNGQFTDGGVNYAANCGLDFSDFGPQATFDDVYGFSCKTTFIPVE